MERVAGVEGGLSLDEVAGEEHLASGQPRDDVAGRVTAPAMLQDEVTAVAAERDGEAVAEREVRVRETRDLVGVLEEPRHPPVLAGPVLSPRSSISVRVISCAMIDSAPKALAPSTRTAW